ncbi:MAG TPA: hypothetical protein VGM39_13200 [Kofleriaceae bacterium]|jgi:hypothetical protein
MRASTVALAALCIAATAPAAHANIFKVYGEADLGAKFGKGTGGDLVNNNTDHFDAAFYENAGPLTYGATVGARFLFVDVHINHQQFHSFSGGDGDGSTQPTPTTSTWTDFAAGIDFELPFGSQTKEDKDNGRGTFIEVGAFLAYGVGTGAQVRPPLDNAQLSDHGFTGTAKLGFGKHLNTIFDYGVEVPVSYGYYFKKGTDKFVNDLSTHYQSAQVEILAYFRANLRIL